jgi:hypothetical protein
LGANAPRENRRGLDALAAGDTAKALKHLEKAAKADTGDARYAYNLGTVQARTRKASPDAALGQALSHAKSPQERARILYNRGTSRYETAKAKHQASMAPAPGGGAGNQDDNGKNEVDGAISDLRQALKLRPGWNEAARNLDLALRLRSQCNKPKNDDKNKDKQDQKQDPQQQPQNQMQQQDAQRLLEAAQAQENNQAKKAPQKKKENDDGPDW